MAVGQIGAQVGYGRKGTVRGFMAHTGASEKSAIQHLKNNDWDFQLAVEEYSQEHATEKNRCEVLFNKYKDPNVDMIMADGISNLCNDLQVDPQDIVMLVLSWKLKAASICEFSKQEFICGVQSLEIDSMEKFKNKIPFLRSQLKDEDTFSEIYNFTFDWAKEKFAVGCFLKPGRAQQGQKTLALETALALWKLLFAELQWPLVDQWCQFIQERHNNAISRDFWLQLLKFAKTVDATLSNYDAEGAWPFFLDEYLIKNDTCDKKSDE
ncbi:hypothetical protein H5410_060213 [Solanum commersonii]|uniref:Defective in cullin neddylation protein n=1 Tax=Solanum commersonii TaxID=4109 RepID=A0A9J5W4Z1_SOLCO|nr:hypothetical protein H5410_060213 [Solanum commersonii]